MVVHCVAPAVPGEPEHAHHPGVEQETGTTAADRAGDRGESQMHCLHLNIKYTESQITSERIILNTSYGLLSVWVSISLICDDV